MKVLFCHDGPLCKDEHGIYYGTAHNNSMFKRYYAIADEISVLIRIRKILSRDAKNKVSKITVNPFYVYECPNITSITGYIKNKIRFNRYVSKAVSESDYIVARMPSFISRKAIKEAINQNKPYLVEVVACPWDAYWNHSLKGKLVAPFMWWATRRAIRSAPYAVYVSNEFLQKRYPCVGKTIGCSDVSLPILDEAILEERIAKIKNMAQNQPIIIGTSAAINVRYKGQQYVIKAIARLNKQGYNFEYHLVGGGDNTYLKSVAKKYGVMDKVKFLGLLPHDKVFDFMKSIDIYVQPSTAESHGRVIIEAMSTACPIIGSSTGGIPELVPKKFVFQRKNVLDLIEKFKLLIESDFIEMAKVNFEKSKTFNKELLDQKRELFYKEFVKEVGNKSD